MLENVPANAGGSGLIPRSRTCPGEGNGNPLQCSCLGNPMDRGAGGLQSTGLQRDRDDLSIKQQHLQMLEEATGGNHFLRAWAQTTFSSSSSPMTLRFHSSVNILLHQLCVRGPILEIGQRAENRTKSSALMELASSTGDVHINITSSQG